MDNNMCAFSLNCGSSLPVFRPQWMQLKQRKGQMVRLFQRLQDYQFEKVREQPDKALTEDTRPLSEEDIARWSTVAHTHVQVRTQHARTHTQCTTHLHCTWIVRDWMCTGLTNSTVSWLYILYGLAQYMRVSHCGVWYNFHHHMCIYMMRATNVTTCSSEQPLSRDRWLVWPHCDRVYCVHVYRLKAVKTAEELSDVYAQFSLYYGRELVDMQHRKTMQKRQGEGDTEEQVMHLSVTCTCTCIIHMYIPLTHTCVTKCCPVHRVYCFNNFLAWPWMTRHSRARVHMYMYHPVR